MDLKAVPIFSLAPVFVELLVILWLFTQIKIPKHILDPCCLLATETVSWFLLIFQPIQFQPSLQCQLDWPATVWPGVKATTTFFINKLYSHLQCFYATPLPRQNCLRQCIDSQVKYRDCFCLGSQVSLD